MEVGQIPSGIKAELAEIKNETDHEAVVEITAEDIAEECEKTSDDDSSGCLEKLELNSQKFQGLIKEDSIDIKSDPEDEPVVGITAQDMADGVEEFKESGDNESHKGQTEPEIQADDQGEGGGFYAPHGNESLVLRFKSGKSQLEKSESVQSEPDWSTLYKTQNTRRLGENDKPQVIKVPLSDVSPSEYTILESKRVQCNRCPSNMKHVYNIRRHIRECHRDITNLYKCPFCSYTSKYYSCVPVHIINKHKSDNELVFFECHLCNKRFKFKCNLVHHIKIHRNKKEELMRTDEIHKWPDDLFHSKSSLNRQTETCHNWQKMQCCHCTYRCKYRNNLISHIQKCHTPLERLETLKCDKCNFTTKFRVDLKKHKADNHSQRFQCEKCPYQTNRQGKLILHSMTHKTLQKEDKKYECNKCDYRTYRKDVLMVHSRTHLRPKESQYLYCYHCKYKARTRSHLGFHIKRHFEREEVEFECYICDFKTKRRQIYSQHIRKHRSKNYT